MHPGSPLAPYARFGSFEELATYALNLVGHAAELVQLQAQGRSPAELATFIRDVIHPETDLYLGLAGNMNLTLMRLVHGIAAHPEWRGPRGTENMRVGQHSTVSFRLPLQTAHPAALGESPATPAAAVFTFPVLDNTAVSDDAAYQQSLETARRLEELSRDVFRELIQLTDRLSSVQDNQVTPEYVQHLAVELHRPWSRVRDLIPVTEAPELRRLLPALFAPRL